MQTDEESGRCSRNKIVVVNAAIDTVLLKQCQNITSAVETVEQEWKDKQTSQVCNYLFCYPENDGKIPFTHCNMVITCYLWVISKITLEFLMVKGKIQGKVRLNLFELITHLYKGCTLPN